jgi:hypothetical protein
VAIPLFLVQPTLFLSIFYFMVGLQQSAVRFLTALAIVYLLVQDVIGLGWLHVVKCLKKHTLCQNSLSLFALNV